MKYLYKNADGTLIEVTEPKNLIGLDELLGRLDDDFRYFSVFADYKKRFLNKLKTPRDAVKEFMVPGESVSADVAALFFNSVRKTRNNL